MRRLSALLALLWLAVAGAAQAEPQFPERGTAPVVDAANIISQATEAALTQKLDQFEQRNQRQFVIATIPSLDGYDIADYGYQLGRYWKLGDKERNDGILLIVAPNDRKVRIEVGYGLESVIPDGLAYDIVEQVITPRFKAGDMDGGITAGADAIIHQLELPPDQQQQAAQRASQRQEGDQGFPFGFVIWIVFIVFFFILPAVSRGGRRYRGGGGMGAVGNVIMWSAINSALNSGRHSDGGGWGGGSSGGGFGGFGGGGGGFSGGGGSFGGGGASGSW